MENILEEVKTIYNMIENKQIPKYTPDFVQDNFNLEVYFYEELIDIMGNSNIRKSFIKRSAYTCLSEEWINPLADYLKGKKCLEIMAGGGALSTVLSLRGVDIICTDNHEWDRFTKWQEPLKFDCVEAIELYGQDIDYIICSWAIQYSPAMYNSLLKMREVNPNCTLIYIGELYGGNCATDEFFEEAISVEDESFIKITNSYKSWCGMHDTLALYK